MSEARSAQPKLRFGPFVADLSACELYKRGKRIKIQQQPVQVLMALLERPSEVVSREDLRKRIWPEDTFVDFEHSLNTAVRKLRQALGDNPSRPKYVETLPRRGYRFLQVVEASEEPVQVAAAAKVSKHAGKVFRVQGVDGLACVIAPSNSASLEEWTRLKALSDDVGISMMITEKRLLLLEAGNCVRVLSTDGTAGWWEARVLDGEHYGQVALVPRKSLKLVEDQPRLD